MVTSKDCFKKYGDPNKLNNLTMWDIPTSMEIGVIPHKLYCNKDFVVPATKALQNIIDRNLVKELKTFDGCFNIRQIRGSAAMSLHSWGIAWDWNATWNQLGKEPTMSKELVQCFKDAGFNWGGDFKNRIDGMHFELANI